MNNRQTWSLRVAPRAQAFSMRDRDPPPKKSGFVRLTHLVFFFTAEVEAISAHLAVDQDELRNPQSYPPPGRPRRP